MYVVGFNGPPRSGKDSLAESLAAKIEKIHDVPVKLESLSLPLRHIAYAMTGYDRLGMEYDGADYERFKVTKWPTFGGATGRELLIHISENFLIPMYGPQVMARMLIMRNQGFDGLLLIRDSGFQREIDPLIEWVGEDNFYIARCHREGSTFDDDSREWVHHPKSIMQSDFYNSDSLFNWMETETGRLYGRLVNIPNPKWQF